MSQNGPKIAIFQFWINRTNRPILMICKLEKMYIGFFGKVKDIGRIIPIFAEKSHFSRSSVIFGPFPTSAKIVFFRRIFYRRRNFDGEILWKKKLMTLVDIHHKYLEVTLINFENIQKANCVIFFNLTVINLPPLRKI